SMISNLLIFGIYYLMVWSRYQESSFTSTEEFRFWGAVILILIPVLIAAKIILYIIFSIINTIITREEEDFLKDEFGRLIESKATRNFHHVFMGGFLLSMGVLVIGLPPKTMFMILLFAIYVSSLTQDISEFYLLRKGI
ncbi:hypothetical protein, partial [Xanthovirga aplysinae]|uniref:hypothetical protein n=1 Tax=Xanthovirga aplysinae TaxID=2529853 RepID=UPI001656A859